MHNEKTPKCATEHESLLGYKSEESRSEREMNNLTDSRLEEITQLCPITEEIMKDPVVASDGHTYERAAITQWQKSQGTSPITRESITAEFKPNVALKKQIAETHKLAREKEKAERDKERAEKKTKIVMTEKESTEQRLERLERMIVAQNEQITLQGEKLNAQETKIDDLDARVRANEKKARRAYQSREEYLKANAVYCALRDTMLAFGISSATTLAGAGVFGVEAGIATAAGATPWITTAVGVEFAVAAGGTGLVATATAPLWVILIPVALIAM